MTATTPLPWLTALTIAAAVVPGSASADCIRAAATKIRAAPGAAAAAIGTLFIETPVQRTGERNGWVQVEPVEESLFWVQPTRVRGWVPADDVAEECPAFRAQLDEANEGEPAARAAVLERAVALARNRTDRIEALEGLVRAREELGDRPRAAQARAELAALRDPARARSPQERGLALAVVAGPDGAGVFPLTYVGGPIAALVWRSQAEATAFMARYLYAGREYALLGGGTVRLLGDPTFPLHQDDCIQSMTAGGTLSGAGGAGLAISGPFRDGHRASALTAEDRSTLIALARKEFERSARRSPAVREVASSADVVASASAHASVDGFVRDLDGDGMPELVGVVQLRAPEDALVGHVLVVAPRGTRATRPYLTRSALALAGEGGHNRLQLLGCVDLDGDGVDELVVEERGYESGAIEILVRTAGWKFRAVRVSGGSC